MRGELDGKFSELALALFRDPMAFNIDVINVFIKEERCWPSLIGLLINKTPQELTDIDQKFETRKHWSVSHLVGLVYLRREIYVYMAFGPLTSSFSVERDFDRNVLYKNISKCVSKMKE